MFVADSSTGKHAEVLIFSKATMVAGIAFYAGLDFQSSQQFKVLRAAIKEKNRKK